MGFKLLKTEAKLPAICAPIVGRTEKDIVNELLIINEKKPDLIEWRIDFFEGIQETPVVTGLVEKIASLSGLPVLVTIRSVQEGGERTPLSEVERLELLKALCQNAAVSMIDYEVSNPVDLIDVLRKEATKHDKQLILSFHDFSRTPKTLQLMKTAIKAEMLGADIVKIAVMPHSKEDVLDLLEFTRRADEVLTVPLITMSMGQLGGLSRLIGWSFGSVLTFGVGVQSSAPGQLSIEVLREHMALTQRIVGDGLLSK